MGFDELGVGVFPVPSAEFGAPRIEVAALLLGERFELFEVVHVLAPNSARRPARTRSARPCNRRFAGDGGAAGGVVVAAALEVGGDHQLGGAAGEAGAVDF